MIATLTLHGLAAGALVDLWRNGSIFDGPRARAEALGGRLGELLGCDFCLTFQAALWLALLARPAAALGPAGAWAFEALLLALAAGRASWILNGLLPGRLRYDRPREL